MVNGLQIFKERFKFFLDQYVLIGGTACDILLEEAGLGFRATKDLDIVLCIETLDEEFVKRLWQFVHDGGYITKERSEDQKRCLYRFSKPTNDSYPKMIELFSRRPEIMQTDQLGTVTPIAVGDAMVSLSAILLDEAYYEFIHAHKIALDGISLVSSAGVIALKAKAWMDLSERKRNGEHVDDADIKKHKNDVFRMYQILEPVPLSNISATIHQDMLRFLAEMENEEVGLSALGITTESKEKILQSLREIYCQ